MISYLLVFFFNDTATTEIYTLSLHDALPISYYATLGKDTVWDQTLHALDYVVYAYLQTGQDKQARTVLEELGGGDQDRKSTRLNSSHGYISYAVFCLKKKKLQSVKCN